MSFLVRYHDWTAEGGFYATKEPLSLKASPTAIFTMSDVFAIGVLDALTKEGLKIPEGVAVVGFDDIKLAQYLKVSLTEEVDKMIEILEQTLNEVEKLF